MQKPSIINRPKAIFRSSVKG